MVAKVRFSRDGKDYVSNDKFVLGWQKGVCITRVTPTEVLLTDERHDNVRVMPRDEVVDNYLYRSIEWDDGPA